MSHVVAGRELTGLFAGPSRLAAYVELARIRFWTTLTYRIDYLCGTGVLLLQIFLFRVVWSSVYADRAAVEGAGGVGSVGLSVQLAYVTLAALHFWVFNPGPSELARRVYEGKIAIDLARPAGVVQQAIAGQVGVTAAMLPFAALALLFATVVGGMAPPTSIGAFVGYVVAVCMAYVVTLLLSTLVGMMAFWILEVSGPMLIYRTVAQVMSGAIAPLWFMPDWLRQLAHVLPFQATTYTPIAIYLGKLTGEDLWLALATQGLWVLVLCVLLRLVWMRALRRVVIQGG